MARVILIGVPKVGNNLMRHVLGLDGVGVIKHLPELLSRSTEDSMWSHVSYTPAAEEVIRSQGKKIIYLTRNLDDTIDANFRWKKRLNENKTIEWCGDWIIGKLLYMWQWKLHADLVVRYEDLIAKPRENALLLADLLGDTEDEIYERLLHRGGMTWSGEGPV